MRNIKIRSIEYIGADIVEKNMQYKKSNIRFAQMNLMKDELPTVDMIFVRDCLIHFSYKDIFKTLKNICKSNSLYLLTTTFRERTKNQDIATGQWRTLNLQISPFNLPEPQAIISENGDKSMSLWEIADIRDCLAKL